MSSQACQALLDTRLKAYLDGLAAAVRPAVQATNMTLAAGQLPYVRPSFLPAQPRQAALGPTGRNRERGIYRVDCYYPVGEGRATGQTFAEAVAAHFPRGTILTGSGFTLKITSAGVGAAREEPDRVGFPVTIEWYADTANP